MILMRQEGIFIPAPPIGKSAEGVGPVAEGVFYFAPKLREIPGMAEGNKERVVAKPSLAAGSMVDDSLHGSGEGREFAPVAGEDNDTPEAGGTGGPLKGEQIFQEEGVVVGVAGVLPGVSRGADSRNPSKGIDFETGVVRNHPSVKVQGGCNGLEGGIFLKGGSGFFDFREVREGGKIVHKEPGTENGPDFRHLVGISS